MEVFLSNSALPGPKANRGSDSMRDMCKDRLPLLALVGATVGAEEFVAVVLGLWLLLTAMRALIDTLAQ